jgi:hypothetical protein
LLHEVDYVPQRRLVSPIGDSHILEAVLAANDLVSDVVIPGMGMMDSLLSSVSSRLCNSSSKKKFQDAD